MGGGENAVEKQGCLRLAGDPELPYVHVPNVYAKRERDVICKAAYWCSTPEYPRSRTQSPGRAEAPREHERMKEQIAESWFTRIAMLQLLTASLPA